MALPLTRPARSNRPAPRGEPVRVVARRRAAVVLTALALVACGGPREPEALPLVERLPDGCWQLGGGATFRTFEGGHGFDSNSEGLSDAESEAATAERVANGWSDRTIDLLFVIQSPAFLQREDMEDKLPDASEAEWAGRLRAVRARLLEMPPC